MRGSNKGFDWWRAAKFGMFIHWGLYSVPGGRWNGKESFGLGEWIMSHEKIPLAQYSAFADSFNPVHFNAKEWVNIAKNAGMRYIVITAKHHDGFAMYHSKCSAYNIVDATPFKRDPIAELADACREAGIKLCFYYSQANDWEHPDGMGNSWDFDPEKKDFDHYLEEKAIPQLKELLTNYGEIGLIWFDTPMNMTQEQSQRLADTVHDLQPNCLVSGRIGNRLGEYTTTGDSLIPASIMDCDWEVPMTLNDSWGFKYIDSNWKPVKTVLHQLIDVNRKGGNYLLNVGPQPDGRIPDGSVKILQEVGECVRQNADSFFDTIPCPDFPYVVDFGAVTASTGKIYLHFFAWPKKVVFIPGIKNHISKMYLLADPEKTPLPFRQREPSGSMDLYEIVFSLPQDREPPNPYDSVVVLEIEPETPDIQTLSTDMSLG